MGSGLSNLLNDRGQACFTAFVFAKSKRLLIHVEEAGVAI